MAVDIAILATELGSKQRYIAGVTAGRNSSLVVLCNENDTSAPKTWSDIPVDDFLNAIAGESLTAAQDRRILQYTDGRQSVPTSKAGIRTYIQGLGLSAGVMNALKVLAERSQTFNETMGNGVKKVSLSDIRKAMRRISTSFIISTGQAELES